MQKYNSCTVPIKKNKLEFLTVLIIGEGKYSPMEMFEETTLIDDKIQKIKHIYPKSDIVYVGNIDCFEVKKNYPKIRVVENKEFNKTNDCTNLKLGLLLNNNDSILIIKLNSKLGLKQLEKLIVNNKNSSIISQEKHLGVGATVVDNKITYIAYGLEKKWIPCIMLTGNQLKEFESLVYKSNNSKMLHEIINKHIENNGLEYFE